jgi:hypothetical protein
MTRFFGSSTEYLACVPRYTEIFVNLTTIRTCNLGYLSLSLAYTPKNRSQQMTRSKKEKNGKCKEE